MKQNRTKRYAVNPYALDMVVPIKKQQVRISPLGKENHTIINNSTGEINGTHTITYRKVDNEEFIKLFTKNIALTFDLGSAGIKAFNVLTWAVQTDCINKDEVDLDNLTLSSFLRDYKKSLSFATFMRGLAELEKAQIIAKTLRQGRYFINPNFIFNGDRIAFTQIIEKDKRSKTQVEFEEKQQDLF